MAAVVYLSDQLEILCQKLAENIGQPQASGRQGAALFQTEQLITQTAGMESWLSAGLTRLNGIFANYRFLKQDDFLEELYTALTGKRPGAIYLRPAIYELLGTEEFKTGFPHIAGYYAPEEPASRLKRIQLAGKIADLFDQYQVYRTSMVLAWEQDGNFPPAGEHAAWQQWLWCSLRKKYPWFCPKHIMQATLLEMLDDPNRRECIRECVPHLSLFAISIFTSFHNAVFERLSRVVDVCYYLVFPSPGFHRTGHFTNPLSAALGMKFAEMAAMLPAGAKVEELWGQLCGESLLGTIRNTIRQDAFPVPGTLTAKDLEDGTLVINACYTPVREVEVFYNYLAGLMDAGAGLAPGDVLVLVPDIDTYGPYIRAVFGNAPYHIPFYIGGETVPAEDTIASALQALLSFDALDGFPSEEVMSLLEKKRICKKYGIVDIQYLREAVQALNIRYGLENDLRDQTRFVSWQYGFEKVMMGFALLTQEPIPSSRGDYTLYPWSQAETSVAYDLLRLKAFLDDLGSYARIKTQERTISQWKTFLLEEVTERSVAYSDRDEPELDRIYKGMRSLERGYGDEMLPFRVFLQLATELLCFRESPGTYISGCVTFLPVIPGRGIPRRVIAMLGMTGGVFPRKDKALSFDLMKKEPLTGDRSKKENDKLAFLESLVASREYLYISYIGKDVKSNASLPPSIVLDELMDYMESLTPADLRKSIRQGVQRGHPLHGFSARYNGADRRLFTYLLSDGMNPATEDRQVCRKDQPQVVQDVVQVEELCRFFLQPVAWYYQRVLGIRYEDPGPPLPESEIFTMDHLQRWELKNFLVQTDPLKEKELTEQWKDRSLKEGNLPLAGIKELEIKEAQTETEDIKKAWRKRVSGKIPEVQPVEVSIAGMTLRGRIELIYEGTLCDFSVSRNSLKAKVRTCIKHLVLCACGFRGPAVFLDLSGKEHSLPAVDKDQAMQRLERLLGLYRRGSSERLPVTLGALDTFMDREDSPERMSHVLHKISEEAGGGYEHSPDRYIARALEEGVFDRGRLEDTENILEEIAELIVRPWQ